MNNLTRGTLIALLVLLAASWAGAGVALWYLNRELALAREASQTAQKALAREEQARAQWKGQASACSAATARLEAAARRQLEAWQAGDKGRQEATAAVEQHVNRLLAGQRRPGEGECDAMKRELDDEIRRRAARR